MPQQRWAGSDTSTPLRSSTATAALPVAGSLYSTVQVAKSATRLAAGAAGPPGRRRASNQREKVSRWKAGSLRSA